MSSSMTDSSTRNRSDSSGGSELPKHEHKRPRLSDTDPDETHVMSDLQHIDTHPAPSIPVPKTGTEEGVQPVTPAVTLSPTSKVTINTRPLSAQSPTPAGAGNMVSTSPVAEDQGLKSTAVETSDPRETISIPSSGSKSPEIEIAEVEDFDQDPAQTRWTGRVGGNSKASTIGTIQPGHVFRTFPFAQEVAPSGAHRLISRMAERFRTAGPQDGDIFRQVKNWMVDFCSRCDEFPARLLEEEREFWLRLPELVDFLLQREAGPPAQAQLEDLVDFFVAYGQITKLLIDYDTRNLRAFPEDADLRQLKSLTLACGKYLGPLIALSQLDKAPFYEALKTTLNFQVSQFLTRVIDQLGDPSEKPILPSITELLPELVTMLSKRPDWFKYLASLLALTSNLLGPLTRTVHGDQGYVYSAFSHLDAIRNDAAELVLKADNLLQHVIVKQAPWLNLENARKILELLNPLVASIAVEVPAIGQDIISSAGVGFVDSDLTDLPVTMPYAWKFKTLRKLIINGRMELRVFGVDGMANDLVQIYRDYIFSTPPPYTSLPLVQFAVKFIQENQLVNYIVGVDSHPQIIRRAANIVGFLSVSKTYSDEHTDIIWKTITGSEDPGTVHEVFGLLQQCFHVYDPQALLYICHKLLDYPFQRFDRHALDFTISLLDHIRASAPVAPANGSTVATNPVSRRLCIRLLRDASRDENILSEHAARIRAEFPAQVLIHLSLGRNDIPNITIDEDELSDIIGQAATNIRAHNAESTGDIQVLTCLLQAYANPAVARLAEDFQLSTLLVEDFAHLYERYCAARARNESLSSFEVMYDIRCTCLQFFIGMAPESFNEDLIGSLWSSLFTAKELPVSIRERAWETLNRSIQYAHGGPNNPFLDIIIDKHLQSLAPQDYSERVLAFFKSSVDYTCQRFPQASPESDDVIVIPGIERLWKIMLEAPPNTVEDNATGFIIKQYLDHPLITGRSKTAINATHSSLVDRCVQQVIASASKLKSYCGGSNGGEDEPMSIIASEQEIHAEELRFDRSLLFLRKFLEGIKSRPRYSPLVRQIQTTLPDFPDRKGDKMDLTAQIHGSKYVTEAVHKITVGAENTGDELFKYLSDASGFTQFTVYHYGHGVPLAGQTSTLSELQLSTGLMLIKKAADSMETVPRRSVRATSPVDNKIMRHFDDLYDLLDADERLSREVYGFLTLFSAQNEVVRIVRSQEKSPKDLLPPNRPFKLLYCATAMRSCIEDESYSPSPDTQFLTYSVRTIVAVLSELDLNDANDGLQMSIAHGSVEALSLALRAKVSQEVSRGYIENHGEFAVQMLRLLRFSLKNSTNLGEELSPAAMVKLVMETLIDACLHDDRLWTHLEAAETNFRQLVLDAFVNDARSAVRHSLLEVVIGLTGGAGSKLQLKINNPRAPRSRFPPEVIEGCLSHIWEVLVGILPDACQQPQQCSDICETMLSILRRIGKSFSVPNLRRYFDQWSSIMVKHNHVEVVGQPLLDHVVASLTKLLLECSRYLKTANALPASSDIIDDVISRFLFPPLSEDMSATESTIKVPVLDITVRESLYSLVLTLSQAPQDIATVVTRLSDDLLPRDFFDPNFGNERQCLRSEVGYAGLRNLANTCYLNSLFSQLFMNVEFRDFLLNGAQSSGTKHKLVVELAKVFAHMQNSYERSIDPSGAVDAITTYDGEHIDVMVQMDVDEFFNLLFDRLEGQISPEARNVFKSIYGGQLVQQIKSKECEHISERLEPFSAVQVEIKGKARLEDSLRAYVEGEVLQGENKYSCTSCGRHVDAVKRACLKDVPDNLIFNLKRFDYDIMSGNRAKINDEFQFPETLDIAPYTLTRLMHPDTPGESDQFHLTGVIVHSGTADSGHYYSFIRQRPSSKPVRDSWVQFNDHDVGLFDPSQLRETCFGGSTDIPYYQSQKLNSAYMLFYQRSSSIRRVEEKYPQHDLLNPVRIPLSLDMEQYIAQRNELFLRSYCAQDGSHAQFIARLLERMRVGAEACSEDHTLESSTIEMALEYIRQVSSRWKECPALEETMKILHANSEKCVDCATTIAQWFAVNRVLEDVIVRNPYPFVRKSFVQLFSSVFNRLRLAKEDMNATDEDCAQLTADYGRSLIACVTHLADSWDLVSRSGRCWGEYFGLLNNILSLGDEEAVVVLEEDYLEKCIDIIMIHTNNPTDYPVSRRLRSRYAAYLMARERHRPFNHGALILFLVNMLLRMDLHHMPEGDYRVNDKKIGLTRREFDLLGLAQVPFNMEWLRRLIAGRHHPEAANSLVEYLARDRRLAGSVAESLLKGLNDQMINNAVAFLRPVLTFCKNCQSENQIIDLVQPALDSINSITLDYAREYFTFVDALLKVENENIGAGAGFTENLVRQMIPHWAPIFLLAPTDSHGNIRSDTVDLLKQLLFGPLRASEHQDPRTNRVLRMICRDLASAAHTTAQLTFLNPRTRECSTLQPGQANQFLDVVEHCLDMFDLEDANQEERASEIQVTLAALRIKAETAMETLSSADWQDNSSEMAELSGDDYEDVGSP
ncbi:Ubiquitin carboxyl-terminal hydrolase 34 [Exophiala dermatitidis]